MPLVPRRVSSLHYAWFIAFTGIGTILVSLGLGRFALGMLLPSMGTTLNLSYGEMGLISTTNFLGYLIAVLVAGRMAARWGARALITAALILIGLSLLTVSQAHGAIAAMVSYGLTGLGSGAATVPVMGLVSHWFAPHWRGKAAGLMVTGNGLGIMASGLLIPWVNSHWGAAGWRISWLVFGSAALLVAVWAGLVLRGAPQQHGLQPLGHRETHTGPTVTPPTPRQERRLVWQLGGIYALFGITYVIYVTFIVTTLIQERGFSESAAGIFWFWLGFLSLFSGPIFGSLSDHLGRRIGLIVVFALQGVAYLLVAAPLPTPWLYLSIGLFGLCAWSIPSIMAAAAGDYLGPQHAVAAFGTMTFIFGIGQMLGPVLAGWLAEASGSFTSSYGLAAALAVVAIGLTWPLPRPVSRKS